ncbi:MAG: IS110 family transposase [Verrucomicrobiales bacterium]|nr:IS110 family transposase [Verrucomicrobiales bacterium]
MNTDWTQQTYFAALDWASDHHDLIVLDRLGAVQTEFRFAHSAEGWAEFTEKMQPFIGAPITLETSSGPAVDQLLQRGWAIYPVAPTAAARYRERKAPSGTKTDRHDTWALADALRTDGHSWRPLRPQDEATATLRLLCRDEIVLIEQRTALVNQLQAALREYYPVALEAFEDWTVPHAWALVLQFPTPGALQSAGKRKWEKFLHTHHLWRPQTAARRLALFARAEALPTSPAITAAKSLLALSLARLLTTLQAQIDEYRRRIQKAFTQHPDHDVFGSLPGAKAILGPRLLGEIGSVREEYPDPDALLCQAGVSPVSYQSGKISKCRLRRACNKVLRATVHLWVNGSRRTCSWAQAYYQAKRDQGHSHASALRCLGKRWLKILWRLWQNGEPYDEQKHLLQLQQRGSPTWQLLQVAPSTCEQLP